MRYLQKFSSAGSSPKGMFRRLLKAVAGSALAISVLLASPVMAAEKPLQIGVPLWVGWTPWYIVQANDMLKKAHVNAELKFFGVQSEARVALASGNLDLCALATNDVVTINANGPIASIIALNDESAGADIMITRGIASGKDLKGKKIGVEVGGVSNLLLDAILQKNGYTESDVDIVNMSAEDAGTAFVAKAIDASVTWEPFASQGIAAGGKALYTSKDTPGLIVDVMAARDDVLKTRGEEVKKVLAVWFAALNAAMTNPDENFPIMAKGAGVSVAEFKPMWEGVHMYDAAETKEALGTPENPGSYYKTVQTTVDFMVAHKLIDAPVPVSSMVTADYLP